MASGSDLNVHHEAPEHTGMGENFLTNKIGRIKAHSREATRTIETASAVTFAKGLLGERGRLLCVCAQTEKKHIPDENSGT
jgi:hypothetical protein